MFPGKFLFGVRTTGNAIWGYSPMPQNYVKVGANRGCQAKRQNLKITVSRKLKIMIKSKFEYQAGTIISTSDRRIPSLKCVNGVNVKPQRGMSLLRFRNACEL